jgi:hypothetical protein
MLTPDAEPSTPEAPGTQDADKQVSPVAITQKGVGEHASLDEGDGVAANWEAANAFAANVLPIVRQCPVLSCAKGQARILMSIRKSGQFMSLWDRVA